MELALGIQELVESFVRCIHDDQQSLKSASAINKAFYASCTPYIFRSITLRLGSKIARSDILEPSGTIFSLHLLLNNSPHIAHLVHELRIHGNFNDVPQTVKESPDGYLPRVLDTLLSLSSIEFKHLGLAPALNLKRFGEWEGLPSPLTDSIADLLKSPNLREIRFKNFLDVPIHLLYSSNSIRNIQMVWATPNARTFANGHNANTTAVDRVRLDSLCLIEHSLTAPPISHFLDPHSPFDLSQLKTFNAFVCISNPTQQLALWEFLRTVGANIEHLGLRSWEALAGVIPDPLDLGKFKSLCSLHLACQIIKETKHPLAWLNHHSKKFTSPNQVEKITLTFKFRSDVIVQLFTDASGPAWEDMDNIIYDATLPCLRAFNIHFHERNIRGNRTLDEDNAAKLKATVLLRMTNLLSLSLNAYKICFPSSTSSGFQGFRP